MKYVLLLLLVLSFVGCSQRELSDSELIEHTTANAVRFVHHGGVALGSGGFIRTERGSLVIVTNSHVCRAYIKHHALPMEIKVGDVVYEDPVILANNPTIDICIVEPPKSLRYKSGLDLGKAAIYGERILANGYPLDESLTASFGYVKRRGVHLVAEPSETGDCVFGIPTPQFFGVICAEPFDLVETSAVIHPGNSGTPVVNLLGKVVGVMNSGGDATHQGNMVPVDLIINLTRDI